MGMNRKCLLLIGIIFFSNASDSSPTGHQLEESTPTVGGNIIGGEVAKPGSTPWLVSIRDSHYSPSVHFCGGTLLNHYWILTTATCVIDYNIHHLEIVLGEYDRDIDESYELSKVPLLIICHPEYQYFERPAYDIAIILVSHVHYSERIKPAYLLPPPPSHLKDQQLDQKTQQFALLDYSREKNKPNWNLEGVDGLIAGWGLTSSGDYSNVVLEANLTILSNEICRNVYSSYLMESLMCAANITYGGVDACAGDSGAGLISKEGYVLGVYTYEAPCANKEYPGLYVNMSKAEEWVSDFIHSWSW